MSIKNILTALGLKPKIPDTSQKEVPEIITKVLEDLKRSGYYTKDFETYFIKDTDLILDLTTLYPRGGRVYYRVEIYYKEQLLYKTSAKYIHDLLYSQVKLMKNVAQIEKQKALKTNQESYLKTHTINGVTFELTGDETVVPGRSLPKATLVKYLCLPVASLTLEMIVDITTDAKAGRNFLKMIKMEYKLEPVMPQTLEERLRDQLREELKGLIEITDETVIIQSESLA